MKTRALEVGQRLRQAREALHLSQIDFAASIGLTRDKLANYERGRTPLPTWIALQICRHFIIGEQWLATGTASPTACLDLLAKPEAVECNPSACFGSIFRAHFSEYITASDAKETAATLRDRYAHLVRSTGDDNTQLFFILQRLIVTPAELSRHDSHVKDPAELSEHYRELIRLCINQKIKTEHAYRAKGRT